MRSAILDGWSGVAGDMWVGAAIAAGAPLSALADAVRSLALPGVRITAEPVLRAGLAGTHFRVLEDELPADAPPLSAFSPLPATAAPGRAVLLPAAGGDHVHRGLAEIEAIVDRADLPEPVRADCRAVYRAIAEVEAEAHGTTIEQVHFHEVGAVDTIVDVVCACLATHLLGIERLVANGIAVGSGTVRAAHGVLPVPAPATAALLR
ncbi:MAG: LarC family nickel insertion protein, partial [Planctomycetes bacterium]|nr:LarC family nickel insertion protein [Planctomycetota bacterium]